MAQTSSSAGAPSAPELKRHARALKQELVLPAKLTSCTAQASATSLTRSRRGSIGASPLQGAEPLPQTLLRSTHSPMAESLPAHPPEFDDLSVDTQIDYVESLWKRIAANLDGVPVAHRPQVECDVELAVALTTY